MRIEMPWVHDLLSRWGRWALRCESGALGFASSCSLGCSGDGDGFDTAIPRGVLDDDMEAVDGAIRKLPKLLCITVIEVYQHGQGKSDSKLSASLGVDRKTMIKYILLAHRKIALDISIQYPQNHAQSVNWGSFPARIETVIA